MSGVIVRQALRRHRWSLLGPACTQALAALVIATMVDAAASINTTLTAAQRAEPRVRDALDITTVFLGDTVYLTMIVVGVTMALAASRQLRDLALVRTIGASPAQVRRALLVQAVAVAVPSAAIGALAGAPAARWWIDGARAHGVLPDDVGVVHDWRVVLLGVVVVLAASVVGTSIASVRVSRLAPAAALVEVAGGRRTSRLRLAAGALLVLAGIAVSITLAALAPAQADNAAVFIMLGECVGVGLLGPVLLGLVARLSTAVLRGGLARAAVDDLRTMTRSLSGAIVPLVLAVSFAGIKLAAHTSSPPGSRVGPADDPWVDVVGTSIFAGFAAIAAVNCFVTVVTGRRRTLAAMQLAGASRRSLIAIAALQAAVVTAVVAIVSAAIIVLTLAPVLHQALGTWWPHVALIDVAALVAGIATLVGAALVGATAHAAAASPVTALAAG